MSTNNTAADLSPVTSASRTERGGFTITYTATAASLGLTDRAAAWFAALAANEALCAVYEERNVLVSILFTAGAQLGGEAIGADGDFDADEGDVVAKIAGDAIREHLAAVAAENAAA